MLKQLGRSLIIGEAVVGLCLLGLLSLGVRDWVVYANVLTFAGATVLFAAASPLFGFRTRFQGPTPAGSLGVDRTVLGRSKRRRTGTTEIMRHVAVALVVGGCSLVTAALIYVFRVKG